MGRIDKENYYLDIAETVLERSTCGRSRYGAINNCIDMGYCLRDKLNIPHGQRYELCRSVHAEMNAIISASRSECLGGTLFLAGRNAKTGEYLESVEPCSMCRRVIINAGIKRGSCAQARTPTTPSTSRSGSSTTIPSSARTTRFSILRRGQIARPICADISKDRLRLFADLFFFIQKIFLHTARSCSARARMSRSRPSQTRRKSSSPVRPSSARAALIRLV